MWFHCEKNAIYSGQNFVSKMHSSFTTSSKLIPFFVTNFWRAFSFDQCEFVNCSKFVCKLNLDICFICCWPFFSCFLLLERFLFCFVLYAKIFSFNALLIISIISALNSKCCEFRIAMWTNHFRQFLIYFRPLHMLFDAICQLFSQSFTFCVGDIFDDCQIHFFTANFAQRPSLRVWIEKRWFCRRFHCCRLSSSDNSGEFSAPGRMIENVDND